MRLEALPKPLLVFDIDGQRQDVFHQAYITQRIQMLARLLGRG